MPVMTKTPNGEDIVILSRQEYDDMADGMEDAVDKAVLLAAMARRAAGKEEILSGEEVDEYLAAVTPMAFWRKRRGLTQAELSALTGLSEHRLSDIEAGHVTGDTEAIERIATALGVTQDQIIDG